MSRKIKKKSCNIFFDKFHLEHTSNESSACLPSHNQKWSEEEDKSLKAAIVSRYNINKTKIVVTDKNILMFHNTRACMDLDIGKLFLNT